LEHPGLGEHIELDAFVAVVDAVHLPQQLARDASSDNEVAQQIAFADVVVLNKCEDVQPTGKETHDDAVRAVRHSVRELNAHAPLLECSHGAIENTRALLGIGAFDLNRIGERLLMNTVEEDTKNSDCSSHHHHHEHDGHDDETHHKHQHGGVVSVALSVEGEMDPEKLQQWVGASLVGGNNSSASIYRAKGVLALRGDHRHFVMQAVHAMYSGDFSTPRGADEPLVNKLVVVGRDLDERALENGFLACLHLEKKSSGQKQDRSSSIF
jgi:G3E family GTPase